MQLIPQGCLGKIQDKGKNMSQVPPEIGSCKHQNMISSGLQQRIICLTRAIFFLRGPMQASLLPPGKHLCTCHGRGAAGVVGGLQ